MKRKTNPFLYFILILVITSLACAALSGGGDTSPPPPTIAPVDSAPIPTNTTAPIKQPTDIPAPIDTPVPAALDFYTEEFDESSDLDNWASFVIGPGAENTSNLKIEQNGDALTLDLGAEDLYLYYMYQPYIYTDSRITIVAENRGVNNNNVALVCRFDSENFQWYEFAFESGGVWYLYAFQDGYNVLDNGGSNDLNQGKAVNEYSMTCEGNVITMYINGTKLKSYTDNKYGFSEGQVGFDISSLNVLPVILDVQSFDIAPP